uniref:Mariner Mos1 transposase n=1 Tax=Anopheles minimus TaxID=112268 RepID=A0A182VSN7_9DIPT
MLEVYAGKLKSIIIGDETWIYAYDPETTDQSCEYRSPNEPRPKKSCQSRSKIKMMLTAFFDSGGEVHKEFLPRAKRWTKSII